MNGIPELREKSAVMHTWFRCVVAVSGSAPVQCPTSEGEMNFWLSLLLKL